MSKTLTQDLTKIINWTDKLNKWGVLYSNEWGIYRFWGQEIIKMIAQF